MKKRIALSILIALTGSMALAGCSEVNTSYSQVCEDRNTGQRVSDANCLSGVGGVYPYLWLYYPYNYSVPAVGRPVGNSSHYQTKAPKDSTIVKKIPSKGGYVTPSKNGKAPSITKVKPQPPKPAYKPAKPNTGYKPAPYKAPSFKSK